METTTPPNAIVLATGQRSECRRAASGDTDVSVTIRNVIRVGMPLVVVGFFLLITFGRLYAWMADALVALPRNYTK